MRVFHVHFVTVVKVIAFVAGFLRLRLCGEEGKGHSLARATLGEPSFLHFAKLGKPFT